MNTIICKNANITANTVEITGKSTNNGDVTINGKLTVSDLIKGNGGLSIDGNISASGDISDSKGDLTSHNHIYNNNKRTNLRQ